jgi:hypothetical protein
MDRIQVSDGIIYVRIRVDKKKEKKKNAFKRRNTPWRRAYSTQTSWALPFATRWERAWISSRHSQAPESCTSTLETRTKTTRSGMYAFLYGLENVTNMARTLLELFLVVFLFWYFLRKKSKPDAANDIKLTEPVICIDATLVLSLTRNTYRKSKSSLMSGNQSRWWHRLLSLRN